MLRQILWAGCVCAATATAGAKETPLPSGPLEWADVPALVARIHAPVFPARDFVITANGAVGDGKSDSLPAIRAAIAACHDAGGGRVVVPPGEFLVNGPIHLESHVNLHVSAGAVLRFSGRPEHFLPLVLTRWEGTLLYNYSPLIYARGAEDIAITGGGVIDGSARVAFTDWLKHQSDAQNRLRQMGTDGTPLAERTFGEGCFLRPSMIQPFECTGVLIEGVTLRDSPFWVIHPVFCSNVTVRGVNVDSLTLNNDGCDPDSCSDVLIEDCTFHTGDDGIAIKAGRDADAWRDGRISQNIVIRHCLFQSKINGLCIGSEMAAGVRNVFMEDCRVEEGDSCIYFKSNRDRGGFIEHVRVRRIQVAASRAAVIRFETNYPGYRGGHAPPRFRDFVIEDVRCANAANYFFLAEGLEDAPIMDVLLRHVVVDHAREPLRLRHIKTLRLQAVEVNGALLPEDPPMTSPGVPRLKVRV